MAILLRRKYRTRSASAEELSPFAGNAADEVLLTEIKRWLDTTLPETSSFARKTLTAP